MSITVGQWVVVKYDEARYPGEVASVDEDSQNEVSVMHPSAATTGNGLRQRTKFIIRMTVLCGQLTHQKLLDTVDSLFLMNKYRNIVYEILVMIIVLQTCTPVTVFLYFRPSQYTPSKNIRKQAGLPHLTCL